MRSTRQKWLSGGLIALAIGLIIFGAIVTINESRNFGGPLPRGFALIIAVFLASIVTGFAAWVWFWQIRVLRWLGASAIVCGVLYLASFWEQDALVERADRRAQAVVHAKHDIVARAYLTRLVQEQPEADGARALFLDYMEDLHASGRADIWSDQDRAFRARWFIYYWTFHDAAFEGFTTFYPRPEDCAFFLDNFGARYAEIALVEVFETRCRED